MDTPRYKTIISVLNSSNEGFDEYIEMSKRISLFVETDLQRKWKKSCCKMK